MCDTFSHDSVENRTLLLAAHGHRREIRCLVAGERYYAAVLDVMQATYRAFYNHKDNYTLTRKFLKQNATPELLQGLLEGVRECFPDGYGMIRTPYDKRGHRCPIPQWTVAGRSYVEERMLLAVYPEGVDLVLEWLRKTCPMPLMGPSAMRPGPNGMLVPENPDGRMDALLRAPEFRQLAMSVAHFATSSTCIKLANESAVAARAACYEAQSQVLVSAGSSFFKNRP